MAHSTRTRSPAKTDRERRENYRRAAAGKVDSIPADPLWWAFRIGVQKAGRALDVDNVAKTIIDAFCSWQIVKDQSSFTELGFFLKRPRPRACPPGRRPTRYFRQHTNRDIRLRQVSRGWRRTDTPAPCTLTVLAEKARG